MKRILTLAVAGLAIATAAPVQAQTKANAPATLLNVSYDIARELYVDINAAVCWSAGLVPQVVSSMNVRSMLRGGSGEAFQYAFHGPGFVVVQPYEFVAPASASGSSSSGASSVIGDLFS